MGEKPKRTKKKKDRMNIVPMINAMHKNDVVYFYLGSLISADNNSDNKDRERNLKQIMTFLEYLPEATLNRIKMESYQKYAEKCADILSNEISENTSQQS